ncbi:MAG: 50S ribosomal protein L11 methyltransferase [Pseudomonadota bacterium]
MTWVLGGLLTKSEADEVAARAGESDRLGYPAAAVFEEAEGEDRFRIDIYFETEPDESVLHEELGPSASKLSLAALPEDVDWVKEGLRDLKPVSVGRFFVHGSHDSDKVRAYHHAILIEAGQAFGTGHHGTTAGCLEAIERVTRRHRFPAILDLGTGSGVLAAALALETKSRVLATDIDPVSVRLAKENMKANGLAGLVRCETAAGFDHPVFARNGPFGLVVANILARPLMSLAQPMTRHLRSNATIILSGLLIRQRAQVLSAYRRQGAILIEEIRREGWSTLILNRP